MLMNIEDAIAAAPYAEPERVSPLVRRVLAKNPSAFTYLGTGTYIVGSGTVAVIDPGPDDDAHLTAILAATQGETISHILVTHTHRDHSPLAVRLKALTGADVAGCAELVMEDSGPRMDAGFDPTYAPDHVLQDGESVTGPGWTLTAVHTPGHTSNHLCFALEEEKALFSGDHIMGWSTTVVSPPDGDMTAYMASLKKLQSRDETVYYPTHGDPVTNPQKLVRGYIVHRRQRENQILKLLEDGERDIPAMVATMYAMVSKKLHGAAGRSVLAHLLDLENRGSVERAGADTWRLAA
ncbi:MBL fold metallo-hydrolase [Pacificimonas sp. WHA3]|uniref:MBL fold metallo-hydrolase n=1 Tax=Pacificimonas pallii TaxID=2827236 RepID=A0ABS6SBY0_9SPHN|nr:MBL fold metallo-hydrolase [Pacificimonas pallii]MBV7255924.1 MBL fold metallo-hydrolase [Pacificimonas pallii]